MPALRMRDLEIMEENVMGDLRDLMAIGSLPPKFPVPQTGEYIRLRYRSLWEEITRERDNRPRRVLPDPRTHPGAQQAGFFGEGCRNPVQQSGQPAEPAGRQSQIAIFITTFFLT